MSNTEHFTAEDWAEMEAARACVDCDEGCWYCTPLPEVTPAEEQQAHTMFQLRAMSRRLGLYYLPPWIARRAWRTKPEALTLIARERDYDALDALLRKYTRWAGPWKGYDWTPPSIARVSAARAAREGGSR